MREQGEREYRDYSTPHTIWLRDDLWQAIQTAKKRENDIRVKGRGTTHITAKSIIERALWKYLMAEEGVLEEEHVKTFNEELEDKIQRMREEESRKNPYDAF